MKYFYAKLIGRTKIFKFEKTKDFIEFCDDNYEVISEFGYRNGRTTLCAKDNDYKKFLNMLPDKFKI